MVVIPHKLYMSKIFGNSATKEKWQSKQLHLFPISYLLLTVIMFRHLFSLLLKVWHHKHNEKCDHCKLPQRNCAFCLFFLQCFILKLNHFRPSNFQAITQKKNKKNRDETWGYFAIPRSLENMFVSFGARVFCGKKSRRQKKYINKPTDVSHAVCSPGVQLTSFSFSPLLCVSGLHHCLLYPCPPRPWNRGINNDSFLPLWPHAGTLKQEPEMQSKPFSVLYLSSTICDRQADRGACCRRNRNRCALCFGSESYLHYTFYKQIRRDTLLERIKGIAAITFFKLCLEKIK